MKNLDEKKEHPLSILKASQEEFFAKLFMFSPMLMTITDLNTNEYVEVNDIFLQTLGFEREEVVGRSALKLNIFVDPDQHADLITRLQRQGHVRNEEAPVRAKSGQVRHVLFSAELIQLQSQTLLLTVMNDITERKLAQNALSASEKKLKSLVESQTHFVIRVTMEGKYSYWNKPFEEAFGWLYEPEGIKNSHVMVAVCDYHHQRVQDVVEQCIANPGQIFPVEIDKPTRGGVRTTLWEFICLTNEHGQPDEIQCMGMEITERKQAEHALRESEEKYRSLLASLDSVVASVDENGRFLYMNEMAARQLGAPAATLVGKTMPELFPEPVATRQLEDIRKVIREDQAMITEIPSLMQGRPRWYRTAIQPVRDHTGRVAYALINSTDIHDLKTAQQELQELNQTLEERVRQATAQVQDLYDNAPAGYHSLDENGNIVRVNQTELNWLGYTAEEVLGRPFTDFLTPASQATLRKNFPQFKQRGWVSELEFEMVRQDGSLMPVLVSGTAIYDEQGNYVMSRSTIFDITERKKAEAALRESEEQNRLLLEESPDAVVLFDEAGRVVRLNRAAELLTGYGREQIIGRAWDELELLPDEQTGRLAAAVTQSRQMADNFASAEFGLNQANGLSRDIEARVFGLKIQDRQHYLATMRDITADKQAAETLRRANAELARAARAKDEFLANMSHELRTPLNAILGLAEMLQEQIYGPLNERQFKAIGTIDQSGRHLLTLINDILDLSKVEAGRLELLLETVPVAEICQASLAFVKELAHKKQLRLTFRQDDQLATIQADATRLKQMLVNLLSNAVKFTPAGGQVSLDVTTDAEAGVMRFAVQDTGIGISAEDLARLFQPFSQVDASLNREYEGTGLGLALVRRLVELHGGSVTVESAVGQGSCFTLALPYQPVEAAPPATVPHPRPGVLRSALVVEDSTPEAEQLARYLQETNIDVTIHPQGAGAVELAARLQPDVILLDLLMPEQSGWTVLTQLKADRRTQAIPVIIISIVDERARGISGGAAHYLVKPVSREELWQAIRAAVLPPKIARAALVIAPPPVPVSSGARILLAEDNEANILTTHDYLQGRGYQVVVARNGQETLDLAAAEPPDLILMDIQMPGLDGLEATRRLRARPECAATPIIALTALAMPGDRERCLTAGANEYLTKPVSLKSLEQTIEAWLKP